MTKRFLSWDCANKTLAWSYFEIDTMILSRLFGLNEGLKSAHDWAQAAQIIAEMARATSNFLKYISIGVVDILDGAKISDCDEVTRARKLYDFLHKHPQICNPPDDTAVVIEHQPPKIGAATNNKSTIIEYQLLYHYVKYGPILVNPSAKNKISFRQDLSYEHIFNQEIVKYKSRADAKYSANKIHSRENFLYLINVFGLDSILQGIPKARLSDVADSTMQVLASCINI